MTIRQIAYIAATALYALSLQTFGNPKLDSLSHLVERATDLHEKAKINLMIAKEYRYIDASLELTHAQEARKQALAVSDSFLLLGSLREMGIAQSRMHMYDDSYQSFTRALTLAKRLENRHFEATALMNLAQSHVLLGDNANALRCLTQALELNEKIGNARGMSKVLNNLASFFLSNGDLEVALTYFHKSLQYARKIGDKEQLLIASHNLANSHYKLNNFRKAIHFAKISVKQNAEVDNAFGVALGQAVLGHSYGGLKEYTKAMKYLQTAADSFQAQKQVAKEYHNRVELIKMASKANEIAFAEEQTDRTSFLAEKLNLESQIKNIEALALLSERKNEHAAAAKYYKTYIELQSQLHDQLKTAEIEALKIRFLTQVKEKENEALKKEVEVKATRLKNSRYLNAIIFMALIVVCTLVYFLWTLYFQKSRLFLKITSQNRALKPLSGIKSKKIHEQTQKINQSSWYNVHVLRAPIAKILGIVGLIKTGDKLSSQEYILLMEVLSSSAEALDQGVRELDKILNHNDQSLEMPHGSKSK